jgi:hypothetical protein
MIKLSLEDYEKYKTYLLVQGKQMKVRGPDLTP